MRSTTLAARERRRHEKNVVYRRAGKRTVDLVLVLSTAIIWVPALAVVALAVRWRLGRPVLFRQQRPGHHGEPFTILKFRTMRDDYDPSGQLLPDANRLTRFGRWLRSTSLDELPELVNVIKGSMSLVGPRPLLMRYLNRYSPEQMRRHEVRPGMTGLAQVSGRNALSWNQKFQLDVRYVEQVSLWLDVKILALTCWRAIRRDGISSPGHATMEEFFE